MRSIADDFARYAPLDCTGDTRCPVCREWDLDSAPTRPDMPLFSIEEPMDYDLGGEG